MMVRNITSAIHVRRGDYSSVSAPIGFYKRNMVSSAVIVTDDLEWVMQHPSVFGNCVVSQGNSPGFDMALMAAASDTVVIGIGTFAWWGAYLSNARRIIYFGDQAGYQSVDYNESDRMPSQWIKRL
jgi:hypothetical protein